MSTPGYDHDHTVDCSCYPRASHGDMREMTLLRMKLEVRTWFLRVSVAINAGILAGFVVRWLS